MASQLEPGWLYCNHCGRSLIQAERNSNQQEAQPAGYPQAPITTSGVSKTRAGSPKVRWPMIAAGIGLLLIVAAIVFTAFWNDTQPAELAPAAPSAPAASNPAAVETSSAPGAAAPASYGKWQVSITNVHAEKELTGTDGLKYSPAGGFIYLVVEATFRNLDPSQQTTLTDSSVTLSDSAGETFQIVGARDVARSTYVMGGSSTTTAYGGNTL